MVDVDEILTGLEGVDIGVEKQVKSDIYSNLLRLYEFASQEKNTGEQRVKSLLSSSETEDVENYSLEGLEEDWNRHHDSFEEKIAYADALDHLQQADSFKAFVGRMRKGFEMHEGWEKEILRMMDDPEYESPIGRESAEGISRESVEEVSNGYEIALKTAIEPVAEEYDLI